MKRRIFYILGLIAIMMVIAGCNAASNVDLPPVPEDFGIGVRVISATEWFEDHPEIVASYLRNHDNNHFYCYLTLNPYKRTLFDGFGFALEYNSPRGHVFSMEGVDATGRYPFRTQANCFVCKSANYPAVRAAMGVEFYATPYEDLRHLMTQPISCFNCHGNVAGSPSPQSVALFNAVADLDMVAFGSQSCAQCHVEYYFHPVTREVIFPYSDLATMYPTTVLEYYNTIQWTDGLPYRDYVNPRSGVRQIKMQHPEFETVYGRGAIHNSLAPIGMAFSCADCHMPDSVSRDGVAYRSHEWMSPLNNAGLLQGTCAACHTDIAGEVAAIQAEYYVEIHSIGNRLAELMERLVLAVESGRHSEATLDAIRDDFRSAQFFWDWVVSENSNGAHNSRLLFRTMEYSRDHADLVEAGLERIGH